MLRLSAGAFGKACGIDGSDTIELDDPDRDVVGELEREEMAEALGFTLRAARVGSVSAAMLRDLLRVDRLCAFSDVSRRCGASNDCVRRIPVSP